MSRMPPGQIMLLMQINCFPYMEQLTLFNGSPAAEQWIKQLLRDELVCIDPRCPPPDEERERSPYNTTERGRVHIDKLCDAQLPVLVETWT